MISLTAFKVLIFGVFAIAWVSVLIIFCTSIKDIREWFSSHK